MNRVAARDVASRRLAPGPFHKAIPALTFLGFAALYGATWSGHYYHDGAFFADRFEEGSLLWCHLGYLPAAELLHRFLGVFVDIPRETALGWVSVLSGALAVAVCCAIAIRLTGSRSCGLVTAALLGVSPVMWTFSTSVEIHSFAACFASLAVWIAIHPALRLAVGIPVGVLVAGLGHLTGFLLAPFLLLAGIEARLRRGERISTGAWALAAVGSVGCIASLRLLLHVAPVGRSGANPEMVLTILELAGGLLLQPVYFLRQVWDVLCVPWTLVVVAFLPLARAPGTPTALRRVRAGLFVVLWAIVLGIAALPAQRGLFGTILLPAMAWGLGPLVQRVLAARNGRLWTTVAIVLQLSIAAPIVHHWRDEPDGVWAHSAAEFVEPPAFVLCRYSGEARHLRRLGLRAVALTLAAEVSTAAQARTLAERAQQHLDQGTRVYVNVQLFAADDIPLVVEVMQELRRHLVFAGRAGDPVLRVVSVRALPP